MPDHPICVRCGAALESSGPGQLCPGCLLREGLEAEPAPAAEADSPAPVHAPRASPHAWLPHAFGDYELLEVIARGGMGVVYRARQISLNRIVAVKMLLAGEFAQPKFIERFRAEAEAVAQLQHPNIVAIHEIGDGDGQPFFSMDLVEGKSLAQVIPELGARGPEFQRLARWVKLIAEAIDYAHQRGIIHRDLKPSNVLIDAFDQPRITDFGLAKRLTDDSDLTQTGQVLGSPNYLPPEQAAGQPAGTASDVYSLGAILYHLLTGRPPFQAESLTALLHQVVATEPVAPRLLNPGIPPDLETICLKCLEKEPARRYPTARAIALELGRFLDGEPIQARRVGTVGQIWKWCQRRPGLARLTGALVLTFLSGLTGVLWQWQQANHERRVAQANERVARRYAYAGDMNLVQRSLEEGNLRGARQVLNNYRPARTSPPAVGQRSPATDLRGWEWRYLWGLCRSEEQFILTQQAGMFETLLLSPNGTCLALRQKNGNIDLWDWATRQKTGTLTNECWPLALAFLPGGNLLASANRDHSGPVISVWDVSTRQIVRTLPQPSAVASLAISPDGQWLATFHLDPHLRLWRMASGEMVKDLPASEASNDSYRNPLFSPDGTTLALGEMTGEIRLLELKTDVLRVIAAPLEGNGVSALAFSPDGRFLAAGYGFSDGTIRIWEVATGNLVGSLEGHRGSVVRLVYSPDGLHLYSASADQTLRVWNLTQRREADRFQGHTSGLKGLALLPDGRTLVTCSFDGTVRGWDLQGRRRQPAHVVLPDRVGPFGAPFTLDSRHLFTASHTSPVTRWEVGTATAVERITALGTNHHSIALSPDQRLLAVGGLDGTLKLWDRQARRLVREWRQSNIPIFGLRFLDRGKSLYSLAILPHQRTELRRWDTVTGEERPFQHHEEGLCYGFEQSPDQRLLVLTPAAGPVRLLDYASGRLEASLGGGGGYTPSFSLDGRFLTASTDDRAYVWEVSSRREVAVLTLPSSGVVSTAFSPDGQRLVTGSGVGMKLQPAVRIWDYSIQRDLLSLWSESSYLGWTQFSPDGNTLLGLSWAGQAELWRAPSWEEIEQEDKP